MIDIIYYTDNRLDDNILNLCREYILASGLNIVSSSLKAIDFGDNKVFNGKRGYLTLFQQIVDCLERSKAQAVFFCEHDVLYHRSHFDFEPGTTDIYYYNDNVWKWNGKEAVKYTSRWLSQLCCGREMVLEHYKRKIKLEKQGIKKRFEPGTRKGIDNYKTELWGSEYPNCDLRHGKNLTGVKRFKIKEFRSEPKNFIKRESVPHWNKSILSSVIKK